MLVLEYSSSAQHLKDDEITCTCAPVSSSRYLGAVRECMHVCVCGGGVSGRYMVCPLPHCVPVPNSWHLLALPSPSGRARLHHE